MSESIIEIILTLSTNLRESAIKIMAQGKGKEAYLELKKLPISTDRVEKAFVTSLTSEPLDRLNLQLKKSVL